MAGGRRQRSFSPANGPRAEDADALWHRKEETVPRAELIPAGEGAWEDGAELEREGRGSLQMWGTKGVAFVLVPTTSSPPFPSDASGTHHQTRGCSSCLPNTRVQRRQELGTCG